MQDSSAIAATSPVLAPVTQMDRLALLNSTIKKFFHDPDLQALEMVLCVIVAHYYEQSDPIWLMVNGKSRSGKTALGINPLHGLPLTWMMGDLTPKTFISGFTKPPGKGQSGNTANSSFLTKVGKSGIFLFKDLTTLMSKRQDQRAEILADLREIHDGSLTKRSGMSGATEQTWTGKVTCIAAVTPAIERELMILRDLGERFVQIRWRSGDPDLIAKAAMRQRGHEAEIKQLLKGLTKAAIDHDQMLLSIPVLPRPDVSHFDRLSALAQIACWGRTGTRRDRNGKVCFVFETESPASIAKTLYSIISARAALHRRPHVTGEDVSWVSRMALDCLPTVRAQILENTSMLGTTYNTDLIQRVNVPYVTLRHYQEELFALGMLDRIGAEEDSLKWKMSDSLLSLWKVAFPNAN